MLTKEEIIKELQKCAKENGGKTPGEKKFYEDTEVGIWNRMQYWPNYGELVREAGLTPNKFDKTKYSKDQLCEMFIGVIREKRKWPTRGELDVRRHKDSNFPTSATFYKKLGLTNKLAETIIDFINDKQGYKDVINICNSVLEAYKNQYEGNEESNMKEQYGWVYLFKHGHYSQYRVGRTFDLLRRGSEIRIQLPERAILIHSIKTVDPEGIETYWLNRFKEKRMNGDWFKLNRSDVREFKNWKRIV